MSSFLLALAASAGCHRRPAGTCRRDIDCPPSFDCKAGRCEARVRWQPRGEEAPKAVATPSVASSGSSAPAVPVVKTPQPPAPRPPDAGAKRAEAATPIELPAPTAPTGRVPLWQQRRKNF